MIAKNESKDSISGGAIELNCNATITNCTIVDNKFQNYGGGVYMYGSPNNTVTLYNTIVTGNTGTSSTADITLNQGQANGYNCLTSFTRWSSGSNNITYDSTVSQFVNSASNDYRLVSTSQAIDKGNNTYANNAGLTNSSVDLAGNPRYQNTKIDIGAYEYNTASSSPTPLSGNDNTFVTDFWYDAEKTGSTSSSSLSWAGSAANILYYTGWASGEMTDADLYSYTFESEDDVMSYFVSHFTNGSGSVYYAADWFLTGNYNAPTSSGWAQNDVHGGGFYSKVDIDNVRKYYDYNDTDAPETILPEVAELLIDGYGIGMSLGAYSSSPNGTLLNGHAVTLWGYTADPAYEVTAPEYYTSLKISDSDDDKYLGRSAPDQLVTVDIHWNSQYQKYQVLNYGSTNRTYWIEEFVAIAPKTEELLRNVVVPTASSISDSILAAALLWEQKSNPAMLSSSSLLNTDKRMVDPIRSQKAFEYQPIAATGLNPVTTRARALESLWDDDFDLLGESGESPWCQKMLKNSLESEVFAQDDLDDLFAQYWE